MTVILLVYVGLLATYSRSGFPTSMVSSSHWPSLIDKPVGEDGYYMLTVSDNIATRGHILYNRDLPATGIQPLATVVFAGLDWVVRLCGGGADALIRSVMCLGALLLVLLAWQISRIARSLAPPELEQPAAMLGFMLTLTSFTLFRLFTYGLETGLYLVLIAACFQVTLGIARRQAAGLRDTILLGLFAGLAGETRIDFGVLFAVLLAILLWYRWLSPGRALLAGGIALLVVSPWFWFVHKVSGSWLPSSGKAESTLVTWGTVGERIGTMAVAVVGGLVPWSYGVLSWASVVVACISVIVFAVLLGRRRLAGTGRGDAEPLRRVLFSRHGMLWLAGFLVLIAIYVVLFNATHFYYRYAAPLAVLMFPACALLLAQSAWIRRHTLAVGACLWAVFAMWAAASLHTGHLGNSQTIAAGYIHRNFPHAHVGSFQSGVIGFFNRDVENLDGKLNQGALKASATNQLPAFIDREGINVLVDWPSVLYHDLPASYLNEHWQPCPVPISGGGESICLMRKSNPLQSQIDSLAGGSPIAQRKQTRAF